MVKQKIRNYFVPILLICIIFISFSNIQLIDAKVNNIRDVSTQASIITMDNFEDFELFTNHSDLTSSNNNTNISFAFTGSDTDLGEVIETYEFYSEIKFRDFEINITLTHSASTSVWGGFEFDFYEVVKTGETNFLERLLCGFQLYDVDINYEGLHSCSCAYNLETLVSNTTNYGDLPATGITTFRLKKEQSSVNFTIIEDDVILREKYFNTTLVDFANSIHFTARTGTLAPNFTINISDISAVIILAIDETTTPTNEGTIVFGVVTIFSNIAIYFVIIRKRNKKK